MNQWRSQNGFHPSSHGASVVHHSSLIGYHPPSQQQSQLSLREVKVDSALSTRGSRLVGRRHHQHRDAPSKYVVQ